MGPPEATAVAGAVDSLVSASLLVMYSEKAF
jgi:hypothetical protein